MRINIFVIMGAICLLLVPNSFSAESVTSLTFKDFYQKVLNHYPKLKQQDANVEMALARKMQAAAEFLPSVNLSTSLTRGDDPVYVFGSLLRQDRFTQDNFALSGLNTPRPHTNYNATINAQIPIFNAFQTISRLRLEKLQIESAQFESDFTKMEAFLVASEAYLRAVTVEQLLRNVNEVSNTSAADIKQAEDLKQKGLILGADYYGAKVIFGNINQMKNQLIQEQSANHVLLNILMGDDPLNPIQININSPEALSDLKSLQVWLDEAYHSRSDYKAMEKMIQAQKIDVKREKLSVLPKLSGFGQATTDTHNLSNDGGQNYIVGIKAQMDVFDPSYSSRIRISKANLKKIESDKSFLKDSIAKNLAQEYSHYQAASTNLPLSKEIFNDAEQAVELMHPLYQEGRKSILDLMQIRLAYLQAVQDYYSLINNMKASWTSMLFLSGQLNESHMDEVIKE